MISLPTHRNHKSHVHPDQRRKQVPSRPRGVQDNHPSTRLQNAVLLFQCALEIHYIPNQEAGDNRIEGPGTEREFQRICCSKITAAFAHPGSHHFQGKIRSHGSDFRLLPGSLTQQVAGTGADVQQASACTRSCQLDHFFRQRTSWPPVISRFTRSYRTAIRLNIPRTASARSFSPGPFIHTPVLKSVLLYVVHCLLKRNPMKENNTLQAWILAARPKTLPAAAAGVLMGSALAWSDSSLQPFTAVVCLLCALLLQIASNLANDVFDFERGTDTPDRLGRPV